MINLSKLLLVGCSLLLTAQASAAPLNVQLIHDQPDPKASFHSSINIRCSEACAIIEWGRRAGEEEAFWSASFNDRTFSAEELSHLKKAVKSDQIQIAGANLFKCSKGDDGEPIIEVAIALWYDENDKYKLSHALWAFSANGLEFLEAESYSRH